MSRWCRASGTRTRASLAALLVAMLSLGLASCGQVQDESSQGSSQAGDSAQFPVTIKHKFGTTKISEPPKRVVVIGTSTDDLDAALALGVQPTALFTKDQATPDGKYPWLSGKLDPAKTKVVNAANGVDPEQVAKHSPDLILATGDFGLEQEYANLAKVAPTVGYESEWGAQSWQEHVEVVGKALGKQDEAGKLVARTEGEIEAVRKEFPGLNGKTFSISMANAPGKAFTLVSRKDFAVKQIEQLGLTLSPSLRGVQRVSGSPTGTVGAEQLDKLSADLLVIAFASPDIQKKFESNPLVRDMPAMKSGAYMVADMQTITQLRYPSVLGIPWALDKLRPALQKAAKTS